MRLRLAVNIGERELIMFCPDRNVLGTAGHTVEMF